MKNKLIAFTGALLAASLLLVGCNTDISPEEDRLQVVASTTLVGDVIRQVGGELVDLTVLLPPDADPHTFEPRPQDLAALSEAQVVFINGLGLEETLEPFLKTNLTGSLVEVSQGIQPLQLDRAHTEPDYEAEHAAGDPHTWTDPNNVMLWTDNITAALAEADPQNSATYQANALAYQGELQALDEWIRAQVAQIPLERRKLVTDHATFAYFADAYGFEQVGLLVASFSTNAAPSAQELAQLVNTIRAQAVPAFFVGTTVNPVMAEQIAQDTGAHLVFVYTGSLGAPGSQADSYLKFMRYNVSAIVGALK